MQTIITPEEFSKGLSNLASENKLVKRLLEELPGGFEGLPKHLKADAYKRMGIKKIVDQVSGITYFVDIKECNSKNA